jgi:uncharacterized protein (TIGR00251 family)
MKNKLLDKIIRKSSGATKIDISVTTGFEKDEISGIDEWRNRLAVRVKDKPIQGRANAAAVRLFSEILGVPAIDVRIASGEKSSLKTIRVELGVDKVKERFEKILGED